MECPYCRADSRVLDSRLSGDDVRRRRECAGCRRRFTTYERLEAPEIRVAKRGDRGTEDFDRAKLTRAVTRVVRGRPVDAAACAALVRGIEAELIDAGTTAVPSWLVATKLHQRLRALDSIAAARFASNYLAEDGTLQLAAGHASTQLALPHVPVDPAGQRSNAAPVRITLPRRRDKAK